MTSYNDHRKSSTDMRHAIQTGSGRSIDPARGRPRRCCRHVVSSMTWLAAWLLATCDAGQFDGVHWCERSPEAIEYRDALGRRHQADTSLTRDGSIWLVFRPEVSSDWATEWTYFDETRFPLKLDVIEPHVFGLLQSVATSNGGSAEPLLNYTDHCALTDLQVIVQADRGWHPSYLTAFDPRAREFKTFIFRHNRDCEMSTRLRLDVDGQRLVCEGGSGPRTACGRGGLPERGRSTGPLLLRTVNFDPMGPDHLQCNVSSSMESVGGAGIGGVSENAFERDDFGHTYVQQHQQPRTSTANSFTFRGTYYTTFVKVAQCDMPQDAPRIGYEVTNRPNRDDVPSTILLTDPTQTILADSTIVSWRIFVKVHSVRHNIYLQVWRPAVNIGPTSIASSTSGATSSTSRRPVPQSVYTLVGQTFLSHENSRLRVVDVPLFDPVQHIRVRRGDVLGLFYPDQNPIGWSSVPCADNESQRYRLVANPTNVVVGRTIRFEPAPADDSSPCRHYSYMAIFANKSNVKSVDDWLCPPRDRPPNVDVFSLSDTPLSMDLGSREQRSRSSPSSRQHHQQHQVPEGTARLPLLRRFKDSENALDDSDIALGGPLAINLLLITVGVLALLLIIVGLVSYFQAVGSR